MKNNKLIFILVILLISILACSSSATQVPVTDNPQPTNFVLPSSTPEPIILAPTINPRCQPASERQTDNIRSGVQQEVSSNDISAAWAVKSADYKNVWFVAAQINGPGIEPGDAVGIWAISGDPDKPGLTFSVDGFAKNFSPYPDGSKTDANITQFDDGAQEAQECAKNYP